MINHIIFGFPYEVKNLEKVHQFDGEQLLCYDDKGIIEVPRSIIKDRDYRKPSWLYHYGRIKDYSLGKLSIYDFAGVIQNLCNEYDLHYHKYIQSACVYRLFITNVAGYAVKREDIINTDIFHDYCFCIKKDNLICARDFGYMKINEFMNNYNQIVDEMQDKFIKFCEYLDLFNHFAQDKVDTRDFELEIAFLKRDYEITDEDYLNYRVLIN